MKIGILTKPADTFFSNGCNQQSLFVYETIEQIPNTECILLVKGDQQILDKHTLNIEKNLHNLSSFDIIIFLSHKITNVSTLKIIKSQNIKIICYNCGNEYYIYQEDIIFDKHNYITDSSYYKYYNEIWSIPNYTKDKYFYETLYNIKFKTVPYVWNTTLIKGYRDIHYDAQNITNNTKMLLICEPNSQITKTCMVPLMICERLYNSGYKNIKILLLSKPETNQFKIFLATLNIYKNNRVELYPRLVYFSIIKQLKDKGSDIYLVSHHRDNPLNFLHLETLYMGYPLIHNCEYYKNSGYYYTNIKEGAEKLEYAINNHHTNILEYSISTQKTLHKFSPDNNTNITLYNHLLNNITIDRDLLSNIKGPKIMSCITNIIVNPTHGFGNRIRFLNTVYQLSKHFNKKLYILWTEEECCKIKFEDIINKIPGVEILKNDINSLDYIYFGPKHLNDIINLSGNRKYDYLLLRGGHEFKLDTINEGDFIKSKSIFYKSIVWSNKVNKLVNDYKNQYNLDNYISVHYRGYSEKFDKADKGELNFKTINKINYYNNLINKVKTKYKILLFSNITNHNLISNRIINVSDKNIDRSLKDDMLISIAEFIILSQSSLIIGTNSSSFSDEASFFNIIPKLMPLKTKDNSYHCYGYSITDNIESLNYNSDTINTYMENKSV